ncbi:MAG: hypothetical protein K2N03_04255 [Muribaculaceae bacterium]|nr:hypothetical protein [Muribaculaceae bacterium]
MNKRTDLLARASKNWEAMDNFRSERNRCKRYTYGRQWDDNIIVDGSPVKEEEYIRSQGNIPLKNNLIRRIVRNVLGVFRNQMPDLSSLISSHSPDPAFVERFKLIADANDLEELYSRTMEEFLISGLAVHRKWRGRRSGQSGCWTEYVNPDFFFIDSDMRDFRGWDASMVGELHDVSFNELASRLADSPESLLRLKNIYSLCDQLSSDPTSANPFGEDSGSISFLRPSAPGRCRVIEILERTAVPMIRIHDSRDGTLKRMEAQSAESFIKHENELRLREAELAGRDSETVPLLKGKWILEEKWQYFFLSPLGDVLAQGESPYSHRSHPYVFKAYPFIDGEIHSFVSDLIDQQRYINRLVTLYDWIMRASAKGVLLFPEGSLPEGVNIDDISSEWSRFNGVILFKPKPGTPLPQQISGNATNIGITDLLNVQLKMMEDVSGVNSALQGKLDSGAVSGTLYNQQTRHALTGLLDILQSFNAFISDCTEKDIVNLTAGK